MKRLVWSAGIVVLGLMLSFANVNAMHGGHGETYEDHGQGYDDHGQAYEDHGTDEDHGTGGTDDGVMDDMGPGMSSHPWYDSETMMLTLPMVHAGGGVYEAVLHQVPGTLDFALSSAEYVGGDSLSDPGELDAHYDGETMMLMVEHLQVASSSYSVQMQYIPEEGVFRVVHAEPEDSASNP